MPPSRANKNLTNSDLKGGIRVNDYTRKNIRNRKRRIKRRFGDRHWMDQAAPVSSGSNVHHEMGKRTRETASERCISRRP